MACAGSNPTHAGTGTGTHPLDETKRVNYTLGMLLGVDDFLQEQNYGATRRRELARELLGHGTVRGLQVRLGGDGDDSGVNHDGDSDSDHGSDGDGDRGNLSDSDNQGPVISVSPGLAWLPSGQPVCVPCPQRLRLDDWLALPEIAQQVQHWLGTAAAPAQRVLPVFLVLVFDEPLADEVPIPGDPLSADTPVMAASRIADGFALALRFAPPAQPEEDALREFIDWLVAIPVGDDSPPLLSDSEVEAQLRAAARAWIAADSPSNSPPDPPPDPPEFGVGLLPGAGRGNERLLRQALRLWATELRPLWHAQGGGGHRQAGGRGHQAQPLPPEEDAVLLAELRLTLMATSASGDWRVSDTLDDPVLIDDSRRPVLLSLRTVQAMVTAVPRQKAADRVSDGRSFGLPQEVGVDLAHARADHQHGTPSLPALGGDLSGELASAVVQGLRGRPLAEDPPTEGQGLVFGAGQWVPAAVLQRLPAAGGDLSGGLTEAVVQGLRGRPLAEDPPTEGQGLVFGAGQWAPAAVLQRLPAAGGDLSGGLTDAAVVGLRGWPLAPQRLAPADGQVLTFTAGQWQAATPPATPPATPAETPTTLPVEPPAPITLAGDVSGPTGALRLQALQGQTLRTAGALAGQALLFDGTGWAPGPVGAAQSSGSFVDRAAAAYAIVAAGQLGLGLSNGRATLAMSSSYAHLQAIGAELGQANDQLLINFVFASDVQRVVSHHVVKLTALWSASSPPFRLFLADHVMVGTDGIGRFSVLLLADRPVDVGDFGFSLQLELSRFAAATLPG